MLDATLQTETQGLLDYAQTLTDTGEELMFTMDVPYVPAQQTPIVLAQAATPGATPQPDYILKACKETETTGDPRSAMRAVDPAFMLKNYLDWHNNTGNQLVDLTDIKITLLEGTTHGELDSGTTNYGRTAYGYDPEPDYVGKDRAVFMAEFEGKRYKIVLELRVFTVVDENNPTCPEPKLIKVKNPSTGSSGYDLNSPATSLRTGISVTFVNFNNAAKPGWGY